MSEANQHDRDAGRAGTRSAFALLWLSETLFDLGAALINFALGVWIFQRTHSAEQFSVAVVAASLPALMITPFAGALADHFDRRWLIAACDVLSVLLIALLAWRASQGTLIVRDLYFFNAGLALVLSLRKPAYGAALGAIVPRDKLTRASGLVGITQSLLKTGAPLLAGYLVAAAGLVGVVLVEMTMALAGTLTTFAAFSRTRHAIRGGARAAGSSLLGATVTSFKAALQYFRNVPLMKGLAAYGLLQESLLVLAGAMFTPLVLSTHSSEVLGTIMTSAAAGGLAGAAMLLVASVEKRLMLVILLTDAAVGLFVLLAGLTTSPLLWCLCAFCAFFCGSTSGACTRILWIRKTSATRRGSILALLGALSLLAASVVMLAGGSLGEHVFEPALAAGGVWAHTVGAWVGTGKGRGLAFLFIVCGAGTFMMSVLALQHPRLRRLDEFVVDLTGEAQEDSQRVQAVAG